MGIREEIESISSQTRAIRQIAEEIEAEGADCWQDDKEALMIERAEWEADQQAVAEFEAWQLQKLLAEQDAEVLAER